MSGDTLASSLPPTSGRMHLARTCSLGGTRAATATGMQHVMGSPFCAVWLCQGRHAPDARLSSRAYLCSTHRSTAGQTTRWTGRHTARRRDGHPGSTTELHGCQSCRLVCSHLQGWPDADAHHITIQLCRAAWLSAVQPNARNVAALKQMQGRSTAPPREPRSELQASPSVTGPAAAQGPGRAEHAAGQHAPVHRRLAHGAHLPGAGLPGGRRARVAPPLPRGGRPLQGAAHSPG